MKVLALVFIGLVVSAEARQRLEDGSRTGLASRSRRSPQRDASPDELAMKQNEIDDRITIGEPYKSLLKTTARFALAQTQVTKHINIETAMDLLNDTSYLLSKPSTLLKAIKVAAVSAATLIATIFFFPGAHQFLEAAWQDPLNTLNLDKYLTNGLQERSVLAVLGSKTDETLARVGLQDNSCRERSLCYLGEMLKCSFPQTADSLTKFATDNFSSTGIRENIYGRAFISGFVDRNCSKVGLTAAQETHNCLGSFFSSLLAENSRSKNQ